MREELTIEHFDEVITAFKEHIDERFDQVEDRIETLNDSSWNGARFGELEERIIKVAERTGSPDLSIPFHRPIS